MNYDAMQVLRRARWRKSSYSTGQNGCVEVAAVPGRVGIRDSKLGAGSPVLVVSTAEWRALVAGVRTGELCA